MKINSLIISLILLAVSNQVMADWKLQSSKTISVKTNKEGLTAYASTDFDKLEIGLRKVIEGGCSNTTERDTPSKPVLINGTLVKMNKACHFTKADSEKLVADFNSMNRYKSRIQELESKQAYSSYYSMSTLPSVASSASSMALTVNEIEELSKLKNKLYIFSITNYASTISYYPATSEGHEFLLGLMKKNDEVCIDDNCISPKGFNTSIKIINGTTKAI